MLILHVNNAFNKGGTGIACNRIIESLEGLADLRMLVQDYGDKSQSHIEVLDSISIFDRITPGLDYSIFRIFPKHWNQRFSLGIFGKSGFKQYVSKVSPDIVQIHWINGGFLTVKKLKTLDVPIIITMHDMWWFTGGCHYTLGCAGNNVGCHACPAVHDVVSKTSLLPLLLREKISFLKQANVHIVVVSDWMKKQLQGALSIKKEITVIGNTLNFVEYSPDNIARNKRRSRKKILLGAYNIDDTVKGIKFAKMALSMIEFDFELLIFGTCSENTFPENWKVHYLGFLNDSKDLITYYREADVFLMPSIQEAFGQTALESLACGTPVVAFEDTGLEDIVAHRTNGYLAKHMDSFDLACGLDFILKAQLEPTDITESVRETFEYATISNKWLNYYLKIYNTSAQ